MKEYKGIIVFNLLIVALLLSMIWSYRQEQSQQKQLEELERAFYSKTGLTGAEYYQLTGEEPY